MGRMGRCTGTTMKFILSLSFGIPALAVLALLCSGPRLGPHYDFLIARRGPAPLSQELLLIEADTAEPVFLESPSAASVVLTLMELNAQSLLVLLPVLDFAKEHAEPASLIRRFDEEFALFAQNIRNLFQAIRTGSIAPEDTARYVDALVELTGQGKKRLLAAAASPEGAAPHLGRLADPPRPPWPWISNLRIRAFRLGPAAPLTSSLCRTLD